jgi:hypothetical protein
MILASIVASRHHRAAEVDVVPKVIEAKIDIARTPHQVFD